MDNQQEITQPEPAPTTTTTRTKPPVVRATTGSAAQAAIFEWLLRNTNQAATTVEGQKRDRVGRETRRMIEWLQGEGFIVVPVPARRGRPHKPAPYTGPAMIGKSHSQKLAGG